MAQKHFIGFNEVVNTMLDKKKRYLVEVGGDGKVYTVEVLLPIDIIQQLLIPKRHEFVDINYLEIDFETWRNGEIKVYENISTNPLIEEYREIFVECSKVTIKNTQDEVIRRYAKIQSNRNITGYVSIY